MFFVELTYNKVDFASTYDLGPVALWKGDDPAMAYRMFDSIAGRTVGHDVTITLSSSDAVTCVNSPYLAVRKGV